MKKTRKKRIFSRKNKKKFSEEEYLSIIVDGEECDFDDLVYLFEGEDFAYDMLDIPRAKQDDFIAILKKEQKKWTQEALYKFLDNNNNMTNILKSLGVTRSLYITPEELCETVEEIKGVTNVNDSNHHVYDNYEQCAINIEFINEDKEEDSETFYVRYNNNNGGDTIAIYSNGYGHSGSLIRECHGFKDFQDEIKSLLHL